MNVNIDEARVYLQREEGFQFAVKQRAELADRAVKVLKQILGYVKQDARVATLTVAIANIIFLNTAILVVRLANRTFLRFFEPEQSWSARTILVRSYVVLTCIFSLVVGMNIALYQGLKLPLKPLAVFAISIGSCASCILFKFN